MYKKHTKKCKRISKLLNKMKMKTENMYSIYSKYEEIL